MIFKNIDIQIKTIHLNEWFLMKDSWLVMLHANRIPPHIGMVINGKYNSLTIKGHELDISIDALLKTIIQKNIESVFIKLKKHPVFSIEYQLEIFQEYIKRFDKVNEFGITCLTPVKLFFEEFYAVKFLEDELFFDFMIRLNDNKYLEEAGSFNFNLEQNSLKLPYYTLNLLNQKIVAEQLPQIKN